MTAYQVFCAYPELFHQIGHYLNIVDPRLKYTGFGTNSNDQNYSLYAHAQEFDEYPETTGEQAYGVDDYIRQLDEWIAANTTDMTSLQKALDQAVAARRQGAGRV